MLVEKWLRESRSGYAIKAMRKGFIYNVAMTETYVLWAGEICAPSPPRKRDKSESRETGSA